MARALPLGVGAVLLRLRLASMLRRRSLPDLLASLTPRDAARAPRPRSEAEGAIAASEALFERLRVVPDTCLYRSLARYAVLRRAGHDARFVMAVQPSSADITGHAWVELDGEPVGETLDPGLTVTFAYPSSARDGGPKAPRPSCEGP